MRRPPAPLLALAAVLACLIVSCARRDSTPQGSLHRWWAGLGPVLPHDTFPADCRLCHVGETWDELKTNFKFDHEKETGVRLEGAHTQAMCLRCHNDRGPVEVFQQKGCVGCHEDFHSGELGANCTQCHTQQTWRPYGQIELHNRTRFPLVGTHTFVACHLCHPGARVGNFIPTDTECLSCHSADLAATQQPPHFGLGWVDNCQRCHIPTRWQQATVPPVQLPQSGR
jgi:nitrate/TMAO reductase-like tetraheme cytochrome c subunit